MNDRLALAIRTIAVSTRAAIHSNEKIGRPDLAAASARRGLTILEELGASLSSDTTGDVRDQYERARRQLMKAAGVTGSTGFTVGADASHATSPRSGEGSASGMS